MSTKRIRPNEKPVAVITDGTTKIGLFISRRLAIEGFKVLVVGKDAESLNSIIHQLGTSAAAVVGHVTSLNDIERISSAIASQHPKIDVLVNNADLLESVNDKPLVDAAAAFDRMIDTNVKSSFLMSHALSPLLKSPGGRIVNLGAMVYPRSQVAVGFSGYVASKAALHGLTIALAEELRPRGISVNTIALSIGGVEIPGSFSAMLNQPGASRPPFSPQHLDDIAKAVTRIASYSSSSTTGLTFPVVGQMN